MFPLTFEDPDLFNNTNDFVGFRGTDDTHGQRQEPNAQQGEN